MTTDENGQIVELVDYDPFGVNTIYQKPQGDVYTGKYFYTGQEWDTWTRLYYYGARYYFNEVRSFYSVDPAGFWPEYQQSILGNPQGWNSYSYVLNNPVRLVDPTGTMTLETNDEGNRIMTIEEGDTLSHIAQIFEMDYQEMAEELEISDPDKIYAGDSYDVSAFVAAGTVIINLKGGYVMRIDAPRGGVRQYHGHLLDLQKNEIGCENLDGSLHHKGPSFSKKIKELLARDKKWLQAKERNERYLEDHGSQGNSSSNNGGGNSSGGDRVFDNSSYKESIFDNYMKMRSSSTLLTPMPIYMPNFSLPSFSFSPMLSPAFVIP